MSSLILSHDSHLMMLEIAVENLFVPWTTALDEVILKKTVVLFRMLDNDWISLSPNRRDYRPYRGSNYENEKFYGGKSVVFSVPTDFFRKETNGIGVQLDVRKQVCKSFEKVSRQRIGFVAVPVDNLLNSIAKQIRERDELEEHLSDFYKRQIISRSMMGTYTLLDENFRDTAATISLYIRISYLGKCLITEITQVKSIRGAFYTRGELDEKQPYFTRQLTSKELQSRSWIDIDLPHVPSRLICRCEELVKKEAEDLAKAAVDIAAIKRKKAPDRKVADSVPKVVADADAIEQRITPADAVADDTMISIPEIIADADLIEQRITPADAVADDTMISIPEIIADADLIERRITPADAVADATMISVPKVADAAAIEIEKTPADVESAAITVSKIDTDDGAIERREILVDTTAAIPEDVKADAAAAAKTKGYAIKDNGERAFKKAFPASKRERYIATIGIAEREKRILPLPSSPFSRLQTDPLCCQLQPHLTCFTDCFDISPCYCYWTVCPPQFFCTVHKRVY